MELARPNDAEAKAAVAMPVREESVSNVSILSSQAETPNSMNGVRVDSLKAWLIVLASFGVQFISKSTAN